MGNNPVTLVAAGLLVTYLVNTVRNLVDPTETKLPAVGVNIVCLVIAMATAFLAKWNFVESYGINGYGGEAISGLLLAGSAGLGHKVFDALGQYANKAQAQVSNGEAMKARSTATKTK